jgi:uncharacterized protein (DUF1800 family)
MPSLPDLDMQELEALAPDPADAVITVDHDAAPATPSRRRFFAMGASAVAVVAGTAAVEAQPRTSGKPLSRPAPAGGRLDPSVDWVDPTLRLVRRITMGLEPVEVARARQLGFAGYLEYQLNHEAIDDSAVDAYVTINYPFVPQTSATLKTADGTEVFNQLADAALYRAAYSKRQLKERMVEFWTDHFNILMDKVGYLKVTDDRDVIRANALGKFPDMLRASAMSAAMLGYLDQSSSRTPTPNQNYAREIMELHTLGVDGGYTQNDVAQLSRILTGFSYNGNGVFAYNTGFHDRTAKTFLGVTFPAMAATATAAQQKAEGDQAINLLINHPSTAKFIALKMTKWLLSATPPQSVVDAVAATYTATGGDIKAMIRTILTGKNLMAAPAKFKRPFHLAASSMRGMAVEVANIRSTRQRLDVMDMTPFYWEQPDGYTDLVSWWSGGASQRWNWATFIANQNSTSTTRTNTVSSFRAPMDTADGVIAQINARMFGGEMPASLKSSLTTYLKGATYSDARVRETLSLAASSHQFQWY